MIRVQVKPELLRWACDRSRIDEAELGVRFKQLGAWERGEKRPTLKQLESFARATHTPIGFFFLPAAPAEEVPIPDLRTKRNLPIERPSPDLLDTLYQCQQRQDWYREFAQWVGEDPRPFVRSVKLKDDVVKVARKMRRALGVDLEERRKLSTWTDALRRLADQAETAGILVMVSGVVGSNSHRKLDPNEFRGFALADKLAPLVFVNGADTKAAQMFTLAHELVHVWLGETALSNLDLASGSSNEVERFCDRVAAELLVPLTAITAEYGDRGDLGLEANRLARHFKVSTLVILRRLFDARKLARDAYWAAYQRELERLKENARTSSGGDFYRTLGARTGRRFSRAVVVSALEGRSPITEACRLLGFRKMATFDKLGRELGVLAE